LSNIYLGGYIRYTFHKLIFVYCNFLFIFFFIFRSFMSQVRRILRLK